MSYVSCFRAFVAITGCALVVALLCGTAVRAHEIGTTRVSVVFQEGRTYDVDIVTDAAALVEKLEASTKVQPNRRSGDQEFCSSRKTALDLLTSCSSESSPADADPARLQSLLAHFDETFRRRVKIAFDASEVRPAVTYSVATGTDAASAAVATIRLRGQIPPDARHFTWTYAWTFASYAMTVRGAESATPATAWLEGGQSSAPFALTSPGGVVDPLGTARRYLTLGFTHIVPHGLDHMLFVLGLCLLSGRPRSVLWQVSAFTVAHSITLGLSLYGVVAVSPGIVEPLIALSIAYVAIENVVLSELKSWRVVLVFAFGLLHGMGFAGALKELGLPRSEFMTALLMFNVGVEAGQLAVIGAAFVLVGWHCSHRDWYRRRIVVPASVLIASAAMYWTIERLIA